MKKKENWFTNIKVDTNNKVIEKGDKWELIFSERLDFES